MQNLENILDQVKNPVEIYTTNGLDKYFEHIKNSVSSEVAGIETKAGRDRVASLAASVSRSKTVIEKPGREYLKKIKELPKEIERELKKFVDQCDELRDEIRQPLTDWENKQREIEQQHNNNLAEIRAVGIADYDTAAEAETELAYLKSFVFDATGDQVEQYKTALAGSIFQLERIIATLKKQETDAAELAILRAEKLANEQRERERALVEQTAKRERDLATQQQQQAQKEIERRENEAAEKIRVANDQAPRAVELERQQVAMNAEILAAKQREKQLAVERLAANKAHQKRINNGVLSDFVALGCDADLAKKLVVAIAKNDIKNLTINY